MDQANWRKRTIAAIDVETTGLDPSRDRIIEIGIVEMVDGVIVDRYEQLVNPGVPIPRAVRNLTGIAEEQVSRAPRFEAIADEVHRRLEGRIPVAYHMSFDRGFIAQELLRCGLSWPEGPTLDPLVFARALLPWMKKKTLGQVAAELGIDLVEAHRAGDDAEAAGRVLYAFGDRLPARLDELLMLQAQWEQQQEESFAIRHGRALSLGAEPQDDEKTATVSLGPAYIYGDEVDPFRALVMSLPDARTKVRPEAAS